MIGMGGMRGRDETDDKKTGKQRVREMKRIRGMRG